MIIGILTLKLHLPGCGSLKEKRRRLKPLLARLHKEFNVSAAETAHNDVWQSAGVGCALVGTDSGYIQRKLASIVAWIEKKWPDVTVMDDRIEIVH